MLETTFELFIPASMAINGEIAIQPGLFGLTTALGCLCSGTHYHTLPGHGLCIEAVVLQSEGTPFSAALWVG
jgi:hypothetical protein